MRAYTATFMLSVSDATSKFLGFRQRYSIANWSGHGPQEAVLFMRSKNPSLEAISSTTKHCRRFRKFFSPLIGGDMNEAGKLFVYGLLGIFKV